MKVSFTSSFEYIPTGIGTVSKRMVAVASKGQSLRHS